MFRQMGCRTAKANVGIPPSIYGRGSKHMTGPTSLDADVDPSLHIIATTLTPPVIASLFVLFTPVLNEAEVRGNRFDLLG
jgi:hypothetical protein